MLNTKVCGARNYEHHGHVIGSCGERTFEAATVSFGLVLLMGASYGTLLWDAVVRSLLRGPKGESGTPRSYCGSSSTHS